jgi:1-acyl-sn-glycerol-3-phosphate acyltransferase
VLRLRLRARISGAEHVPADDGRSCRPSQNFLDAAFAGIATRRDVRCMAKIELFKCPPGRLFVRLGASPLRRGEGDAQALKTARTILAADASR